MTEAAIALYLSSAAMLISMTALIVSGLSIKAWRVESYRNKRQDERIDKQDEALAEAVRALAGLQGWMSKMQETTENTSKNMGRAVSHLSSERRTRAGFSTEVFLILDGICEKIGIEKAKRDTWKNSSLRVLKEMQEDAER